MMYLAFVIYGRCTGYRVYYGLLVTVTVLFVCVPVDGQIIDGVDFGNSASERAHQIRVRGKSKVVENDAIQGTKGRSLLPPENGYVNEEENKLWGNSLFIKMKVDPQRQNYFSARFWGGEVKRNYGRLVLLADGKLLTQTGKGSFEPVDKSNIRVGAPPFPGRFYYTTTPLPKKLTKGRQSVVLEIRHFGRYYRYNARTLKKPGLYWPVNKPSRAIYRAYTHTGSFYQPPQNEKQGKKPRLQGFLSAEEFKSKKKTFGKKLRKRVYRKVKNEIKKLQQGESFDEHLLLKVFDTKWTPFYRDERIAQHVDRFINELDTRLVEGGDRSTEWIAGDLVTLNKYFDISDRLNEVVQLGEERKRRRMIYADAFVKAQKSGLSGRKTFTNQADWQDGRIYPTNRALQFLAPDRAMPEKYARRIELEMIGLKPHSGNWVTDGSPDRLPPEGAFKNQNFTLYTDKGQGRERGFVANYGEMQNTVAARAGQFDHDQRMKKRILKQAHNVLEGRVYFWHPHWDGKGKRTIRQESVIGTRHALYPGKKRYIELDTVAKMRGDELALKLMHRRAVEGRLFSGERDGFNSLIAYRYYDQWLNKHEGIPPVMKLPVEQEGDFVWADHLNGVVVFKHGKKHAWVNFMFRTPGDGVNDITRIHFTTPVMDRLATVRSASRVLNTNGEFTLKPNAQYADDQPPHAVIPGLELFWAGQKWPRADRRPSGRADLFLVRYGSYFILMNTNENRSFDIDLAAMIKTGTKVSVVGSGQRFRIRSGQSQKTLDPRESIVLYLRNSGE